MIKKILLLTLLILSCSGCKWFSNAGTPFFSWTKFKTPPGTPAFQQGWRDGCSTSSYARGNMWYRMTRKHGYNPKMIGNPEYRFGYGRGYTWCFQNVLGGIAGPQASFDKAIAPYADNTNFGYGVFDTKAADMSANWSGFFGGNVFNSMATDNNSWDGVWGVVQTGGGKTVLGTVLWEGGSSGQFFGQ
jgi:hypothetical protein